MDDVTTGIIDDIPLVEEAAAPKTEGADGVGEDEPKRHKRHPRPDIHPTKNRPSKKNEGNGGESELKIDERGHGVERVAAGLRYPRLPDKELLAQSWGALPPEGQQPVAEGHAVADENPANEDGGEGV